eukprot:gene21986-47497_t
MFIARDVRRMSPNATGIRVPKCALTDATTLAVAPSAWAGSPLTLSAAVGPAGSGALAAAWA